MTFTSDQVHRCVRRHLRRTGRLDLLSARALMGCWLRTRGPALAWHHAAVEWQLSAARARRAGKYGVANQMLHEARHARKLGEQHRRVLGSTLTQ